jgi:HPr kinase/phosphorylase
MRSPRTVGIHATCVLLDRAGAPFGAPADAGVLILGKSGAGKSDLALRLVAMGAKLVADDRTDLFVRRGRLYGRAPKAIAGLMEVREVGILALPFAASVRIALVVEPEAGPRLPDLRRFQPPAPLLLPADKTPPLLAIAPFEISAAAKIAVATAAYERGLHRETVNTI